jgi:hypothetical protein
MRARVDGEQYGLTAASSMSGRFSARNMHDGAMQFFSNRANP